CCAVVHHGGAGTLFSGIQAGCPTLVCPCYGDNYFWGELIQKLGAGPAPLSIFDWTVDSLAQVSVGMTCDGWVKE
ncbi:glyco_transf_28 domain-containing protein, partial [Haematococcus lacustris]